MSTIETSPKQVAECSAAAQAILQSAVTIARNRQIRRLKSLRAELLMMYPGREDQIEEALKLWAEYAVASHQRNGS